MALFKDMLHSDESLFKNELALDYSFLPKILPHREQQQRYIATIIKPLLTGKNGKNIFIYGAPGIGKTAAIRFVLNELEEETEEVVPVYINCWQKNTTFKILVDICEQLGYRLTHNKRTEELFQIVKNMLNKKAAVFAFDEVDKLEEIDFLYAILEDIYKKSILLITNDKEWLDNLDDRVKSRLLPESLEFKPYNLEETKDVLKQRVQYAFVSDVWDDDSFELIVKKTAEAQDIRIGLHLMRESGNIAEDKSSRKITLDYTNEAIKKIDEFTIKKSSDLTEDEQNILNLIKKNSEKKIGDLYNVYKEQGGELVYKSFQRKIEKLEKNKFVTVKKTSGGADGNTSIVKYATETKKLTEF
ncbi:MAG: AAA family ATPase [Candidatus Woesearchaeota archaeon]|jgi:cell division control protein 6|nr:AAA family ATPase [Candidatus Woesearchaeota archaeon]|tara:strand:- start:1566 stop:2639 length:1074 start_codon:yes stop_codon:yes gene_type:complete